MIIYGGTMRCRPIHVCACVRRQALRLELTPAIVDLIFAAEPKTKERFEQKTRPCTPPPACFGRPVVGGARACERSHLALTQTWSHLWRKTIATSPCASTPL